jgi:hypothetical protein
VASPARQTAAPVSSAVVMPYLGIAKQRLAEQLA